MNVSNQALRDYLRLANIFKGDAIKNKTDLIEMIIYECTTNKLNKETMKNISSRHPNQIMKINKIDVKLLSGHGNDVLRKNKWHLLNIIRVIIKKLALNYMINNYQDK